MVSGTRDQVIAAFNAAGWTMAADARQLLRTKQDENQDGIFLLLRDERSLAGLLAAIAMFMMYYFY